MTQHLEQTRKAMTAIAAVLAFSSTPLLAQDTGTPAPIVDPAPEPVAPAADPLAPEPAAAEPTTTAPKSIVKPKAASTVRRSTSATRSVTRTTTRAAPVAPATAPTTTAAVAPAADPAAQVAAGAVPVAPGPMPVAPVDQAAEQAAPAATIDPEEALPIAGGAALGLMLLGGAAAMRRRKRRKEDEADEAAKMAFIEAAEAEHGEHPAPPEEPAFVRAAEPRHDPVPAKTPLAGAPTTELPEDFDLSRFGPHVQAAYRGPTEDNPSLSLKHRLRRASFLDQQERRVAEEAPAKPAMETPESIPAQGKWESRPDADFLFYRAGTKSNAKPVLQDR
jgi:hypothetical protein